MPVLHQMQMSGNCYKIRLLSRQLGLDLKLRDYPLHGGLTRRPEFLARNPNGRVPLLELDDGRHLPESGAILWYLSAGTPYQPADDWARAEALSWMFFEQYSHEPYVAVARFWLSYSAPEDRAAKKALIPDWHAKGNAALAVMENHLKTRDWFAGGRYSIADIALYGYTHCADEGGFELSAFPALNRWLARVSEQPGYIPLSEHWQPIALPFLGVGTISAAVEAARAGEKFHTRHADAPKGVPRPWSDDDAFPET
ncbi:MAG TPA: glutathione S-transferase family protein [Rhizomicrobium sp.]|nr:glutathione S-transferase family protein [Rhizomicrobium sp.]